MSSSVSATNRPSFSSNDPGQIARRIAFSSMHSIADSRSFTAYRAPECSSPWCRPVVPEVNSPRSTSVTRMPRNVRSWASAPPVPPPPTIRTCGASRDARGADRVIDASIAPRPSCEGPTARPPRSPDLRRTSLPRAGRPRSPGPRRSRRAHRRWGAPPFPDLRRTSPPRARPPPPPDPRRSRRARAPCPPWCPPPSGLTGRWPPRCDPLLHPVERARHGLLPERVLLVALRGVHAGLPFLVLAPVGAEVLDLLPEPDGQSCGVRRTERGGLRNGRTDDRDVQDVRLELHQRLVVDHAAVHLE